MPVTRAPARSLDEVKKNGCYRCGGPHFKKDKDGRLCTRVPLPSSHPAPAARIPAPASGNAAEARGIRQWSLVAQSQKPSLVQDRDNSLLHLQAEIASLKSQVAVLSAQAATLSHLHLALHMLLPTENRVCCGTTKEREAKSVDAVVAPVSLALTSDAKPQSPASPASKSSALLLVSPRPHGKTSAEQKDKDIHSDKQVAQEAKRGTVPQVALSQSAGQLAAPFHSPNRAAANASVKAVSASKQVSSPFRSAVKRSRDTDDLSNATPTKKAAVSRSKSVPVQPMVSPF